MKSNLKLVVAFVAAVLLLVLGVVVAIRSFIHTEQAAAARQHLYLVIKGANGLQNQLINAETGQRGFSLTGDETFLEPYLAVRDGIPSHLLQLRQMITIHAALKHMDALAPLHRGPNGGNFADHRVAPQQAGHYRPGACFQW